MLGVLVVQHAHSVANLDGTMGELYEILSELGLGYVPILGSIASQHSQGSTPQGFGSGLLVNTYQYKRVLFGLEEKKEQSSSIL